MLVHSHKNLFGTLELLAELVLVLAVVVVLLVLAAAYNRSWTRVYQTQSAQEARHRQVSQVRHL